MARLFIFFFLIINISARAQIPAYIPKDGLVAWYPFSCNANDLSVNRNDAMVYEAAATADRFGNSNSAYYFDGINNYISAPAIPALNFTNKLSLSVWVKLDDYSLRGGDQSRVIIGKQRSPNQTGFNMLALNGTRIYAFGLHDGSAKASVDATDTLSSGTWHNIVAVYDGATMYLYKDGILIQKASFSITLTPSSQPLYIGGEGSMKRYFKGAIDDVALWNRALSPAEVSEVYSGMGSITGLSAVTVGKTIQLGTALQGGTWRSSSASIATVSEDGRVTGVAGGRATVWYAVPNECGSSMVMAQMPLRVSSTPVPEELPVAPPEKMPVRAIEKTPVGLAVTPPKTMQGAPAVLHTAGARAVPAAPPPVLMYEQIQVLPVKTVKTHVAKPWITQVAVPQIILPEPELEKVTEKKAGPSDAFSVSADVEKQELVINTDAGGYTSYTITTTTNKVLVKQPIKGAHTKVDISLLQPGSYYIMLEKDGKVKTTMFVKDR